MGGTRGIGLALCLVAGCNRDARLGAPGVSTLVRTDDGKAVFAVNVDEGTLSRLDPKTGAITTVAAGGEPTRLARAGDRLFVSLRTDGALVAFDASGEQATESARTNLGAEPYGVVTTADGSRVYVALSLEDAVVELDGSTLKELRRWTVQDEPRWLALTPSEQVLFAASHRDGRFTRIDLESGETSSVSLPEVGSGHGLDHGTTPSIDVSATDVGPGRVADFDVRITGDPAVSSDGSMVAVPAIYVDTETPVTGDSTADSGGSGYAATGAGIARINPAVILCDLSETGAVEGPCIPVLVAIQENRTAWRSYPSAVLFAPGDRYLAVPLEGSDAVIAVDTRPFAGVKNGEPGRAILDAELLPASVGMHERPMVAVSTGSGPRGVTFTDPDTLRVHTFLDRRVQTIDWKDVVEAVEFMAEDREAQAEPYIGQATDTSPELDVSAVPDDVARGRLLFWSARDERITSRSGGVSCATCHFDGRNDGLTWTFLEEEEDGGVRSLQTLQTPSLAGGVAETAPLTWTGDVDSVFDEALATSSIRMGGRGLTVSDLTDIEAFVEWTRFPVLPPQDPDRVAQGKALFERSDVGCATCHSGERFTDNLNHEIEGEVLQTPSLTRIAATAPYLHDGRYETLAGVLAWATTGAMGNTSGLTPDELDALEAYLRSL